METYLSSNRYYLLHPLGIFSGRTTCMIKTNCLNIPYTLILGHLYSYVNILTKKYLFFRERSDSLLPGVSPNKEALKCVYINSDGGSWIRAVTNYVVKSKLVADRFHLMKYINRVAWYTLDEEPITKGRFYKYILNP